MKKYQFVGTLVCTKHKSTSVYGNPSRYIWAENESGETFYGFTGSDYSCGYGCDNYLNKKVCITYHVTRKGSKVVEHIKNA